MDSVTPRYAGSIASASCRGVLTHEYPNPDGKEESVTGVTQ